MELTGKNILVIDDTQAIRTFISIMLQAQGAVVHEAGTAADGLRLATEVRPDLTILDLGLPDRDGLDILSDLKQKSTVIILSVRKDADTKATARQRGAAGYLSKPFQMEELQETLAKIGI